MLHTSNAAYRWAILGTAFLGVFGTIGFGRFGYSAVLPPMQQALGLSGAAAGSLASWSLGAYMAMALVGGLLASKFGPRIVMTVGIVVNAGGMLLTGLSQDLATASIARLLTGVGNGLVLTPALALMAAWYQPHRLVAVLTAVVLRNRPLASANYPRNTNTSVLNEFAVIVRSTYAWHLGIVYLLYGFAFITFLTFFQRRLIGDLGYSNSVAGYMFLAVGIASIVFGLVYGLVSDRFGRGRAMATTLLLEALAALLFSLRPGTVALVVAGVIFGSGGFSMPGLIGAACGERFGTKVAAASLGFVTIFIGVGQALGPYLSGLLADATSSYGPPYLLAAGAFLVSAVAAWFIDAPRRTRRREQRYYRPGTSGRL